MKFLRKHIVPICAILTLIAVGSYETFWLHRMYVAEKESVKSVISSSVIGAEVEEYLERVNVATGSSKKSTIVTRPSDSSDNHTNKVKIYKIDNKDFFSASEKSRPDIDKIQHLLMAYLDSTGLDIKCQLIFEGKEDGLILTGKTDEPPAKYPKARLILTVQSNVNDGHYKVLSDSFSRYIANQMSGIAVISAGILLIIAIAFSIIDNTIKKRRRLDEMKNDFTQNITHELKTPIAVAYAASDTLLEYGLGEDPAKRKEYLSIIKDQLDKLGGMVEMILSITMESRKGLRLDYSDISVKPMFENAAFQMKMKAEKQCDISVDVVPDSLEITVDRRLMSSVILTILDNALKYSGESVKISMKAYRDRGKTILSISDNGIGISPSSQKHIFEKFYRVPTGCRHDVKGYGIGLFFAKNIVEKHGGKISVFSEPGKGSSFIIEL